jgi:hypothetical protein
MSKRLVLVTVILLVGLATAVVGATAALRLIGSGTFGPDGKALSTADVRRSLEQRTQAAAASHSPAAAASPAGRHTPVASQSPGHAQATTGVIPASGGTVFASCLAGQVTLTRWIPAGGYGTDGVSRGPAGTAWVRFKSAGTELTVTATCVSGRPHFATSADDHGGGGH